MDITRHVTINFAKVVKPTMGPMNSFHHMRAFQEVVRPNFDTTLYSSAWLDLTQEPMVGCFHSGHRQALLLVAHTRHVG
jgi:hypothetical protein